MRHLGGGLLLCLWLGIVVGLVVTLHNDRPAGDAVRHCTWVTVVKDEDSVLREGIKEALAVAWRLNRTVLLDADEVEVHVAPHDSIRSVEQKWADAKKVNKEE